MSDIIYDLQNQITGLKNQLESLRTNVIYPGIWQSWTSTVAYAGGTTDPTSLTVNYARYTIVGKILSFFINGALIRGTGDRTYITFTLPINYSAQVTASCSITFNSVKVCPNYGAESTKLTVFCNGMTSDGSIWISGSYEIV